MIINVLANGDIKNIVPENIYQGSNKANTIVLLAPFSASVTPTISFELPQTHEIKGVADGYLFNEPTEVSNTVNMWTLQVDEVLTQYYGDVKYQIKFVNTDNEVVAVARGKFKVNEGVDFELPATPSQDVYELLLQNISNIRADFLNGWIEAHGIREYNSEFAYGLGSYVFGVVDNKTMFFRSLIENNKGNALTNTSAWKSIIIGINGVKVNGVEQPTDIDGNVELTVPTKLSELTDDVGIPSKLSELTDDIGVARTKDITNALVDYYTKDEVNNLVSSIPSFDVEVVDNLPTENISEGIIYLVRKGEESPNLFDEYIYVNDKWELLGTQSIATNVTATSVGDVIEDTESIVAMVDGDKLKFELDADLTSKISKSLTVPMDAPSSTELVAVDDGNSQTMVEIGEGLRLENGVLSATATGGGASVNVVDNLTSQSSTDALSAKQGNVLYNMLVEGSKIVIGEGSTIINQTVDAFADMYGLISSKIGQNKIIKLILKPKERIAFNVNKFEYNTSNSTATTATSTSHLMNANTMYEFVPTEIYGANNPSYSVEPFFTCNNGSSSAFSLRLSELEDYSTIEFDSNKTSGTKFSSIRSSLPLDFSKFKWTVSYYDNGHIENALGGNY